jgi:hypothetical protein
MFGWFSAAGVLALLLKVPQSIRLGHKILRQHLDRHIAVEARVARAEYLAHPARADGRVDLVWADSSSGEHCLPISQRGCRQFAIGAWFSAECACDPRRT